MVRPSMYKLTELFKTEVKSVSKTCQYVRFIVQYTGLCADILVGGTSRRRVPLQEYLCINEYLFNKRLVS